KSKLPKEVIQEKKPLYKLFYSYIAPPPLPILTFFFPPVSSATENRVPTKKESKTSQIPNKL
ncbi:MAG: hypothetical protein LBF88_11915, partial [Planctomycetaceae bacterium]|nr:hypothetical protein [Planctomycetaceae bacterium]